MTSGRKGHRRPGWRILIVVTLLLGMLGVVPTATASEHNLSSRTPVNFTYTLVEQVDPGETWEDEGGGFHVRNGSDLAEVSGDIAGTYVDSYNVDSIDITGFVCPADAGGCSVHLTSVWGSVEISDEEGGWHGTFLMNIVEAEDIDTAELPVMEVARMMLRGTGAYSNQSVVATIASAAEDFTTIEFSGVRTTLTRPLSGQHITAQICFDEQGFDGGFLASGLIEGSGSVTGIGAAASGGPWTHQYGITAETTLMNDNGSLTLALMGSGRDQFTPTTFSSGAWGQFMVVDGTGMYAETYGHGRFLATVGSGAACNGGDHLQLIFLGEMHANTFEPVPAPEPEPGPVVEIVATGLNSPRGMTVADGTLYIAEAGAGGDTCVEEEGLDGTMELCFGFTGSVTSVVDGMQAQAVSGLASFLFGAEGVGPQDVIAAPDGWYVIMGLGGDPADRAEMGELGEQMGWILHVSTDGTVTNVVDVAAYESEANPDGGPIDSNPYSLVATDDGGFVVSDAGMNALLKVSPNGEISTLAVFEARLVDPGDLPIPDLPPEVPMEAVPTGVTIGPDGAYYVGELTGFPFQPGAARVWRVTEDGEATVYADGFTNVIDVAFDSAGNLYVLEITTNGLANFFLAPDDPAGLVGALHRVAPDGSSERVEGLNLILSTGLTVGPDDIIYVANFGLMTGGGEVLRIAPGNE